MQHLLDHIKKLDVQVGELTGQIKTSHRNSDASRKLDKIPGIGPITASALVAMVGDARRFGSSRQLPAWIGLMLARSSTGGKSNVLGIRKLATRTCELC